MDKEDILDKEKSNFVIRSVLQHKKDKNFILLLCTHNNGLKK